MIEVRCQKCGRFLLKLSYGQIEVKCDNSKCKHVNKFKIVSHAHLRELTENEEVDIIKA